MKLEILHKRKNHIYSFLFFLFFFLQDLVFVKTSAINSKHANLGIYFKIKEINRIKKVFFFFYQIFLYIEENSISLTFNLRHFTHTD